MKKVHIVPHVHWDREWYFSSEESKILLVNDLREVIKFMEEHPDYPTYVLDGQTSIIDDFATMSPNDMPRLKKLIEDGRILVGPWFTQTDEMTVGGESMVRNMYYGLKDARKLGNPMMIGYLPDSFGQTSQLPQILNGFGITRSIFWRGISERHGTDRTEFNWTGPGKSSVTTQLFPLGYAIGKYLPTNDNDLKKRMDKYFGVLDRGATTENEIIPNGHDQMPIQKNISEVIEKLQKLYPDRKFFLSRYENVFEELEKVELPTISGEMIDGKYSRVHRSIFSMRADLKSANTRIENKITTTLEPLMAIAFSLGFDYQDGTVESIWKDLMVNHAHDSMGACCSDKVHSEILARYRSVEERVDRLIEFYQRKISESTPNHDNEDKLVVFNTLESKRETIINCQIISKLNKFTIKDSSDYPVPFEIVSKKIIDPGLIDRQIVHYGDYDPFIEYQIQLKVKLPAVGYKTFYVAAGDGEISGSNKSNDVKIENSNYSITANNNGTIDVTVKESNKLYRHVLSLENVADDGDEYDFSPLVDDEPDISSNSVRAHIVSQKTIGIEKLKISYDWRLPKNLQSRKLHQKDGVLKVNIEVTLTEGSPVIGLDFGFENLIDDQRTRVLIPTDIESEFSIADNQFGRIERPTFDSAMNYWKQEEWDERPDTIYPFLSHVALTNSDKTVGLITNSVREYQVIGENYEVLAITLFRGVGFLGKEKLLRRPGRPSGIKLSTPDSQLHGKLHFDLGIVFANKSYEKLDLPRITKSYLTKVVTYNQIPYNAMKLNSESVNSPEEYSLFELEEDGMVVSTIKTAEDKSGVLVRLYNMNKTNKFLNFEDGVQLLDLNEKVVKETNEVSLEPNQFITMKIESTKK